MSVVPYPIQCLHDGKWATIQTDKLLPGDVVSIGESRPRRFDVLLTPSLRTPVRQQTQTTIPADILLISGTCIVNEVMLSGESTPLLKESIQLLEGKENSDVDGLHKGAVLFSGTKVLQAGSGSVSGIEAPIQTLDAGCPGVVLRTGFGTAQGHLVKTIIFSTERVTLLLEEVHPPRLRCPSSIVLIVPLHRCSLPAAPLCRLLNWAVHLLHPPSLHIILALSLVQPNCRVIVATIGIHYSLDDLLVLFQDETNN